MLVAEWFNIKEPYYFEKYGQLIDGWRKDWGIPPLYLEMMPSNGIIVRNDNEYICAGWFYMTECPIALMGHYISAKKKGDRKEAMSFLIESLEKKAKNLGFKKISTFVRNPNLISTLEKLGYGEWSEKGQTNFVKNI